MIDAMKVTAFVTARIAEQEAWAHYEACKPYFELPEATSPNHPRRVLAQCAAMRKVVELYQAMRGVAKSLAEHGAGGEAATARAMYAGLLRAIQALACIWSDHADFREEWRP